MVERLMRKNINLTALIEQDEDGIFVASVPLLRGCFTQANTIEDLLPRITEAIQLCLDVETSYEI